MLTTMKILACLLVSAAANAEAGIKKPRKSEKLKRRSNAYSTIMKKAYDRRDSASSPMHVEAIHNRIRKKNSEQIGEVEDKPDTRAEKRKDRKERKLANAIEEKGRILKKSKKSGNSHSHSGSSDSDSNDSEDEEDATFNCSVTLFNLSAFQSFQDVFVMVHSDKLDYPIFEMGKPATKFTSSSSEDSEERRAVNNGLVTLAQEGRTQEMEDFYEEQDGVYDANDLRGPIKAGKSLTFQIEYTDTYNELSFATSLLFSNDGFVGVDSAKIASQTAFIPALDAGIENNLQTCWSVKAQSEDYPINAKCNNKDKTDSNDNENDIPGEGFVHVHSGISQIDAESDIEDVFEIYKCKKNGADDFTEYFFETGVDDDFLLSINDDQTFIRIANLNDYDDEFLELAADSDDFDDFCKNVDDFLDDIFDINDGDFATLEPELFDWRNPIMLLSLSCV